MRYSDSAISDGEIPRARQPAFQHLVDTYASESNKVISTWRAFSDEDLPYRPHPKSSSVEAVLKHELLSGRRFFAEFLHAPEPEGKDVLPDPLTVATCCHRFHMLVRGRLNFLADQSADWWLAESPFFDVTRQHIWIFWRRVLHTAHHRAQLTVYLRLLNKTVPAIYGPTADVSWSGADPTHTVAASERITPA